MNIPLDSTVRVNMYGYGRTRLKVMDVHYRNCIGKKSIVVQITFQMLFIGETYNHGIKNSLKQETLNTINMP